MPTRPHSRAHARTYAHAHAARAAHATRARTHAHTHAHTHAREGGPSTVDEGGSCARSGLWGMLERQRTGCRAWACGGAACRATRPGLGRSGHLMAQAALSPCCHLCSASEHGHGREGAGCAGRATRQRGVHEAAAVRDDDVVMLCGRARRVGSTNERINYYCLLRFL